jgi:uncharacterized protein with GYD domain
VPTYISLINWTDSGVANFKGTVGRAEDAKRAAAGMGGTIKDIYWTVGSYDIVTVAEFPDDVTATAFLLALSSAGNLRTTTLRAFNADEMSEIVAKTG